MQNSLDTLNSISKTVNISSNTPIIILDTHGLKTLSKGLRVLDQVKKKMLFTISFFKDFICLTEGERESTCRESGRQREREKQAPRGAA